MSETRTPISGNLKALDQNIKEKYSDKISVTYYFDKTLDHNKVRIFAGWIKLCWKIAGSSYVFVDDYSPIFKFIDLKGKVKLTQLWHAGVGFKAVGYARFGKDGSPYPYESGHRKYDYVVVGAEELIPIYSEVFGLAEDRFLPYGLPRLDGYLDGKRRESFQNDFYQKYPELRDKKIILFAPTYRGATQKEAYYPYEKLENEVLKRLGEMGYVFCIKMHPFVKEKFDIAEDLKNVVYDFSDYNDINELFYITDILITDYSSNIYEFALFRKPIIFFAYDYREYKLTRGMQTDLKELGVGKVCAEFKEIEEVIEKQDFNMSGIDEYIRRYHCMGDMLACDAIISNIILNES